jgi:hypothetical protein
MVVIGRSYATPHPTMSTTMERGATAIQAPTFLPTQLQGPRNLLHHDTTSGYGLAVSTVIYVQPRHATTTTTTVRMHELREKLGLGSILGPFFYFYTSRYCNSIPPFAYYKKGGRDPRQNTLDKAQQWQCTKHTLKHSNTHTHTHRDLGAIPLSTSLYLPTTSTSVQSNTSSSEH